MFGDCFHCECEIKYLPRMKNVMPKFILLLGRLDVHLDLNGDALFRGDGHTLVLVEC